MNTSIAKSVLPISYAMCSLAGCGFLCSFWLATSLTTAVVRSAVFMMTMAIVHLVGYRLFVGQAERGYGQRVLVMDHLWPHLKKALFWQLSFMAVSSLVLDGGQMFRICLVAAIAHWLSIASIATRSPGALSVGDIRVIRWGYPAAFGIALVFNFVQNQ